MSEEEAIDFILDCFNAHKELTGKDPSIWEPVRVIDGKWISGVDGRTMTEEEVLKRYPEGTWI